MSSVSTERRRVNGMQLYEQALDEAYSAVMGALGVRLSRLLEAAIAYLLGRERYERRRRVAYDVELAGQCARCHSHQSRRFSRNGHRSRTLTTRWGHIHLRWPRVKCQCGGSLQLDVDGWLLRYQRIGFDVDAQIARWGALGLSLRHMQQELQHSYIGPLALRTLCERLHQLRALTPVVEGSPVPPVLEVDGFYLTQLRPNGAKRRDAKGRLRPVKGRFKRCVLVALGLWPDSGRQEILAFELVEREDTFAWLHFFSQLEAQGVNLHHGLRLIIHDGGAALRVVLDFLHLGVPQQRCLFHKLQNIAEAIQLPENLPPPERWPRRKAILKDFQAIWQTHDYHTVLRRYLHVYRQYRHSQPAAVAALRRDFRDTLTYYRLLQEHPTWPRQLLRTTSHLERFNRRLRQRCRAAGAYHSDAGVQAMLAQTADQAFKPGH